MIFQYHSISLKLQMMVMMMAIIDFRCDSLSENVNE